MAQLSSTSAGAIGGALTLVFNYVVGAFWQIFASHMPLITPPSAELIGSEQLLVTALFTNWASKEGVGLTGNIPSKDEIMSSLKADANTAAAILTAAVKPAASAVLALFLASCAGTSMAPSTSSANSLSDIAKFTISDLEAADADAKANGDNLSAACYEALIPFVKSLQGATPITVSGAFSVFQKARDLRLKAQSGVPVDLKLGCAPLVMDEQLLLIKLGAIGAGSAVIGPLVPVIGASLPIPIQ